MVKQGNPRSKKLADLVSSQIGTETGVHLGDHCTPHQHVHERDSPHMCVYVRLKEG